MKESLCSICKVIGLFVYTFKVTYPNITFNPKEARRGGGVQRQYIFFPVYFCCYIFTFFVVVTDSDQLDLSTYFFLFQLLIEDSLSTIFNNCKMFLTTLKVSFIKYHFFIIVFFLLNSTTDSITRSTCTVDSWLSTKWGCIYIVYHIYAWLLGWISIDSAWTLQTHTQIYAKIQLISRHTFCVNKTFINIQGESQLILRIL